MEIEVWSEDMKLERTWYYSEPDSPWTDPQPDMMPFGTKAIGTVTYNQFLVRWTTDNPSYGPTPGQAAPGAKFHTGIGLKSTSSPAKPIIVVKVTLKSGGTALPLSPRMIGYDSGTLLSTSSGVVDLNLGLFNADPEESQLCVSDVTIRFLPRMAAIETMTAALELDPRTRDGLPIPILGTLSFPDEFCIEGGGSAGIRIAGLTDPRFLDGFIAVTGGGDVGEGDPRLDPPPFERFVGLFPSIYTYVTATVRDPVTSQESRLFYQFVGTRPDCNQNGIDDLLEIEEDGLQDSNMNGLPDECEVKPFQRGDANGDAAINITDPVTILNFLFLGGTELGCLDAADVNDDGTLSITDPVNLLNHLFQGGPPPALPYPDCGLDPTDDALGCVTFVCP